MRISTSPSSQLSTSGSPLVSRKEAATYLGLAPQTLAQWACSGRVRLPMVKVGRKVQYRKTDLDAFIVANTQCITHT
jgi:excisionase family DNA binding protein